MSERRSGGDVVVEMCGGDVVVVVESDTRKILGGHSNTPFVRNDTHTLIHSHCSSTIYPVSLYLWCDKDVV